MWEKNRSNATSAKKPFQIEAITMFIAEHTAKRQITPHRI